MKIASILLLIYIFLSTACSVVEIVVENQATSRSISEAKRDPECSNTEKQGSSRIRESSKDRSVDLTTEPL
jgi:beta-lactamase regulating signal transducer with metallopeptidase domain